MSKKKSQTLAEQINVKHALVEQHSKACLAAAIQTGILLMKAKEQCEYGNWEDWVKNNTKMSLRTAQLYMQLAKNRELIESKAQSSALFTIENACKFIREYQSQERASTSRRAPKISDSTTGDDDGETTVEAGLPDESEGIDERIEDDEFLPSSDKRAESSEERQERSGVAETEIRPLLDELAMDLSHRKLNQVLQDQAFQQACDQCVEEVFLICSQTVKSLDQTMGLSHDKLIRIVFAYVMQRAKDQLIEQVGSNTVSAR